MRLLHDAVRPKLYYAAIGVPTHIYVCLRRAKPVSAAIQLAPLLRTPFGQASIFTANLDNLPPKLWFTVMPVAHFAVSHPAAADELEALATGLAALATWGVRPKKWG